MQYTFPDRRQGAARAFTLLAFLALIILSTPALFGQKFIAKGGEIPDFHHTYNRIYYPINITGLPETINTHFGLERVCLNITHAKISDLKIELMAPDSTTIWITNRNGGDSGQHYTETCFDDRGFNGYVYEGKSPFVGVYIPDGRISDFNNGQNPNGAWYLVVQDLAEHNTGRLDNFQLIFGNDPPKPDFSPCHTGNGKFCQCPDGKTNCELLPDLIVSDKITRILNREYGPNDEVYPRQIRIAVATANIGWGPLEVRGTHRWVCGLDSAPGPGTCPDGSYARQYIEQIVYVKKGDSLLTYTTPAGTNYYDSKPGHDHFHAERWVEMTLRKKSRWRKDPMKWKIVGKGSKISYCLFDSGNCNDENNLCQETNGRDTTYYGFSTLKNYGFGHYIQCESYLQGISVGGIDNYGISFEGQYIQMDDNIRNGNYVLMVEVDPDNRYKESNEKNNYILVPVELKLQNETVKKK